MYSLCFHSALVHSVTTQYSLVLNTLSVLSQYSLSTLSVLTQYELKPVEQQPQVTVALVQEVFLPDQVLHESEPLRVPENTRFRCATSSRSHIDAVDVKDSRILTSTSNFLT